MLEPEMQFGDLIQLIKPEEKDTLQYSGMDWIGMYLF